MRMSVASEPSTRDRTNEDWVSTSPGLIVVLDGATARTDTGCRHGISWYAAQLGAALSASASNPDVALPAALAASIQRVAALHPECDLTHEGTPSAAVAAVRLGETVEYLVLGDVSVVLDLGKDVTVVSDERVSDTALAERQDADRYPIGSPEKNAAMVRMKHIELSMRNRAGGYWIAAADPSAAEHALTGEVKLADVRRLAVLTDGAARIVSMFGQMGWPDLLDTVEIAGPDAVLRRVRSIEDSDPDGARWPRNKCSDDATIAYAVDPSLVLRNEGNDHAG
ncbi:protein phosphatase 2C domain-containing protein [Dactylosporangium sp. NPDC051485]|uniref:protein phosphatase 2C domain-containing protein n=1 Tax=Dactylosporangium sp. NPDC051485 TaxID=3154846 RepID=UPI00342BD93D